MISYVKTHKRLKRILTPVYANIYTICYSLYIAVLTIVENLIRNIPCQLGGSRIRKCYYSCLFKAIDKGGRIDEGIIFYGASKIECGRNVFFGRNLVVQGSGGLKMGDDILIGPGCYIWTINHDYTVNNIVGTPKYIHKSVIIGNNVWIAANVKITPGVTIGSGSVIAMGSVVTEDVPPDCVVAGNPAKLVKKIPRPY